MNAVPTLARPMTPTFTPATSSSFVAPKFGHAGSAPVAASTRLAATSHSTHIGTRRSPFQPDAPQRRLSNDPNAVEGPDRNRPREFLEQFPLDTLRMVGTLADRRASFGLVQTNDGLVHRITVGNHMGQNYGRVVSISDSEIQLVEIISDGLGGYLERPAAIGLTD